MEEIIKEMKKMVGEYARANLAYIDIGGIRIVEIINFEHNKNGKETEKNNLRLRVCGVLVDCHPTNELLKMIKEEMIIKHSKNIIDLIEVGDYVNGYLVIAKSDDGYIEIAVGDDTEQGELLEEKDIKSIVTKEQFANAEYKVKE